MQLILVIITTGGSTLFRNTRTSWMAMNFAISLVGTIMVRQISPGNKWARYAGVVLAPSYASNFPLILSLMSSNFGGFTKKTTVNAMVSSSPVGGGATCIRAFINKMGTIVIRRVLRRQHNWTSAFHTVRVSSIQLRVSWPDLLLGHWACAVHRVSLLSRMGK